MNISHASFTVTGLNQKILWILRFMIKVFSEANFALILGGLMRDLQFSLRLQFTSFSLPRSSKYIICSLSYIYKRSLFIYQIDLLSLPKFCSLRHDHIPHQIPHIAKPNIVKLIEFVPHSTYSRSPELFIIHYFPQ